MLIKLRNWLLIKLAGKSTVVINAVIGKDGVGIWVPLPEGGLIVNTYVYGPFGHRSKVESPMNVIQPALTEHDVVFG